MEHWVSAALIKVLANFARAQVLGDFTLYDYKKPLEVPSELHGSFDVVVADPPYLVRLMVGSNSSRPISYASCVVWEADLHSATCSPARRWWYTSAA